MSTPLRTPDREPTLEVPHEDTVLTFIPMRDSDVKALYPDRDWLWELASQLQKSLRVEELVRVFSEHVRTVIRHDSVEFRDDAGGDPIRVGRPAEHSCAYDVHLPEEHLGTITLTRSIPFSRAEMTSIENIVLNLVYPLRNALLFERVLKVAAQDTLTGLGNRASLDAAIEREIASACRHREPLTVIMVDVDHFKRINDAHGHVAGDLVLKSLAHCIAECIRDSDLAFRYGGEEFVILLRKTGLAGAGLLAERVRARVEGLRIPLEEAELTLTASFGIACLAPEEDGTRLLERADAAMYLSKSAGRNQVSLASAADHSGLAGTASPASSAASARP